MTKQKPFKYIHMLKKKVKTNINLKCVEMYVSAIVCRIIVQIMRKYEASINILPQDNQFLYERLNIHV